MGKCELFIKIHRPIIRLACEIPKNDNLILMGNHPHKLDPLLIKSIAPDVTFVKDDTMINSPMIKTIDCDLDSKYMGGLSNAFIALLEKNVLCIFPEGEINKEKELKPFVTGALTLAIRSKAKIMPFAITGSYNLFKGDRLTINVGNPFIPNNLNQVELATLLHEKIYELKKK
jgi:1-acyl-sn-glycerol-3-phosphate acyltransferase